MHYVAWFIEWATNGGEMIDQMVSLSHTDWIVVNDTVMGGRSTAFVSSFERGIRFEGILSTEHNGGFNSTRSQVISNASTLIKSRGIQIEWEGSDRPFQMIVHLKNRQIREYYRCWLTSQPSILEWRQFEFRRRGQIDTNRLLEDELEYIDEIGILLSDGRDGPWWIEIHGVTLLEA